MEAKKVLKDCPIAFTSIFFVLFYIFTTIG